MCREMLEITAFIKDAISDEQLLDVACTFMVFLELARYGLW